MNETSTFFTYLRYKESKQIFAMSYVTDEENVFKS